MKMVSTYALCCGIFSKAGRDKGVEEVKAPQIIMIVSMAISLYSALQKHAKPKEGNESFWVSFLGVCIEVAILWWGGFWN